ncbi:MAG: FkbM family methyltransferase [Myxococcota bacterium]
MFTQKSRHELLQKLFWNPAGSQLVRRFIRYEQIFDTVVRGYSLIGATNGERWLTTLMPERPTVFDVGFHDGASTAAFLASRALCTVHAFDPSRFASKSYTARFTSDDRVRFTQSALSNEPGELPLHDYENMCNSLAPRKESMDTRLTVYSVPVTTLDIYCRDHGVQHIDFLKIDAEGYDLNVLEGAQDLLNRQGIDVFVFEFASGWAATKRYLWEAVEFLDSFPYRLFHLYNGFLCPLSYDISIDSCTTRPAMYVGLSKSRFARGDVELREYQF